LVLSRNQLIQLVGHDDGSRYYAPIQQLNRITTDLQEVVMQTRMQPVGAVWSKLPRIVRDIAQSSGKQIAVEMTGSQTELDRQLMQVIQDPLTHIVRNSADHGIELPHVRNEKGKSATGVIRLHAYHESGHVVIEITDDGAGIDLNAVRRKAVSRGLLHREAAESLTDREVLRFVFEPGLSTAEQVTHVSGRGVGMDVVRSNIEKIGGTVELDSVRGRGCTVRIRIPLTLAIIPALLVEAGGETFAVPQGSVLELIRVSDASSSLVERIYDMSFYRLREMLLPLVDLDRLLGLPARRLGDEYNVVVCQLGEDRFGLAVDEVFDTQEIVVKPVGRRVKALACYAGCTILGDGRVIMILDPTGIAGRKNVA
jgi:two-component system chemotaxis sensor kinase CheA